MKFCFNARNINFLLMTRLMVNFVINISRHSLKLKDRTSANNPSHTSLRIIQNINYNTYWKLEYTIKVFKI